MYKIILKQRLKDLVYMQQWLESHACWKDIVRSGHARRRQLESPMELQSSKKLCQIWSTPNHPLVTNIVAETNSDGWRSWRRCGHQILMSTIIHKQDYKWRSTDYKAQSSKDNQILEKINGKMARNHAALRKFSGEKLGEFWKNVVGAVLNIFIGTTQPVRSTHSTRTNQKLTHIQH